ncbi:50S ribosomal protein L10 [Geosporobacter ferrireducens]|uniref:Large ribosomal subunit protein uL10 n=1 Tax=Geosporobacter ferrireducens TaxID=1424294 RepID=A0A1D8GJS8_9FIRM|nr:50S ribosomal protein L10 [Geosporobacter ferrireducens]AOT71157.1 50S ribosomal protein L10 [Geosporobacter ferrireducens]MTI57968.1 50S ribosomal protein L10 [Geosporobacter ferrireducens]
MSSKLDAKKQIVEEIKGKFSKAQSAIIVDYRGLKVEEVTELRSKMREAGVEYKVYKNTMTRMAAQETGFEALLGDLTGPNAIAFGYNDPVTPAKILSDFAKDHKKLELKAGLVEGQYCDVEKVKAIANIPSREVLLAQFLGSIKSPLSNLAYLLQAIADKQDGAEA